MQWPPRGLPWSSLIAYLRITTNPRLFERPATIAEAMGVLDAWLQFPNVWIPGPTERHRKIFWELAGGAKTTGNLVPDAHLAAIAIEHGLELCTADGAFSRFEGLRWKNPLRGSRPS